MIRVGIIGATGYAGEELVRLLSSHPEAKIIHIMSKSFCGKKISELYASYLALDEMLLEDIDYEIIQQDCDVVFTCLPHEPSIEIVPKLLACGVKVIDLSGSFRYKDAAIFEAWYGIHHTQPELLKKAVYGLSELYEEEIAGADLIGNPGCYTTASILALYPVLACDLIQKDAIIIDAKSGVTGAGRSEKLPFSFSESHENFKAYGVTTHRHTSEIEEQLSFAAEGPVALSFTPHLLPVKRGILATIYADLPKGLEISPIEIQGAYEKFYMGSDFIQILPHGSLPELKFVVGSNNCFIGYKIDERLHKLIIVSCIDNLIKGAAGQAVQNMNLMFGLDGSTGLPQLAMYL